MHNFELRMSKMEMVLGCTAGYHKSLELDGGSNEAADDGTGTHHLIDTKYHVLVYTRLPTTRV
jgi:hypothetical protein